MNFPAAPRRVPALKPLALATAISLCLIASAHAEEQTLATVTITGARFASDPALMPIGATVIDADDIRRAGAADVNQAIRKIGGVYGRQNPDGSSDFGLDLRGFGTNSGQNLVVMLDGVRLSENDLGGAVLSTIPIESVERIEITRGGASVLFGDGATGGVIQIVTKRPTRNARRATLLAEAGQFGLLDLNASMAQSWDGFALDAAVGRQRTDNYRDHNDFEKKTFAGGAQWAYSGGRAGVRVDIARQESDFAGPLATLEQFRTNPRQATTPKNFGSQDTDRVTAFVEQRVGSVDLAAELSHREKTLEALYDYGSSVSTPVFDSKQTQFSPRMRHLARFSGMLNEVVAGIDLIHWERVTKADYSLADARQKSTAYYVRDELKWDAARLSAGVRHETFDKDLVDPVSGANDHTKQSHNAWEVQGSVDVAPKINLYAKTGRSFRMPNSDENGFRTMNGVLAMQTSRDLELGATFGDPKLGVTARAFRHDLTDEIFFDPTATGPYGPGSGANTNLDPTERKGFELDAHAALGANLRLNGSLQHVNARFTEGPNAGREMVLVPKNVLTARLSWAPANGHSADIGGQWVDSQRYGGDFANDCKAKIASYATFDARYARQLGAWEFAVTALNLGDKQYVSQAYGCPSGFFLGIYPSDGRQLKVSARYDFR